MGPCSLRPRLLIRTHSVRKGPDHNFADFFLIGVIHWPFGSKTPESVWPLYIGYCQYLRRACLCVSASYLLGYTICTSYQNQSLYQCDLNVMLCLVQTMIQVHAIAHTYMQLYTTHTHPRSTLIMHSMNEFLHGCVGFLAMLVTLCCEHVCPTDYWADSVLACQILTWICKCQTVAGAAVSTPLRRGRGNG